MKRKSKNAFFLAIILIVTTLIVPSFPNASATPTITEVKPNVGPVGTNVTVIGQIDTLNGSYRILWDEESIKNGTCPPGSKTVNDTFIVPPSVKGNHNITLLDIASGNKSAPAQFTVVTFYFVSAKPAWIQEGLTTTLNLNLTGGLPNTSYNFTIKVTDPRGALYNYTASVTVKSNSTGIGWSTSIYPTNFTTGANTNYTGTYSILVDQIEPETKIGVATGNFTVGLTDKLEYHATETVKIRGSGYLQPNEHVWINVTLGTDTVFSENKTAFNGMVGVNWTIPTDAEPGTYTVTLTNATTPGTKKTPPDIQNFTVIVVKIDSIEPSAGPVGTTVRVVGEIIKPNGSYKILWDTKSVKEGACALESRAVNDTFIVPPSVKGNHTITLRDTYHGINSTSVLFSINETTYHVFAKPEWVQEGLNTNITISLYGGEANKNYTFTINVTDPTGVSSTAALTVTSNETGSGVRSKGYWQEFVGANVTKTNFVGTYSIAVKGIGVNLTGEFIVGLTDKPEYKREETVNIQGAGYLPNENVTVNIEFGGISILGYPRNLTADAYGIVTSSWYIPVDAMPGTYTVSLVNATTPGTIKTPSDIQNFTVTGIIFQIQTLNLDKEPVADADIEAYSNGDIIDWRTTNETGLAEFRLEAGNYTFRAFWIRGTVEIGSLFRSIPKNATLIKENMTLSLARIGIEVKDEVDVPLYLIDVSLKYNYTTRANTTGSDIESLETNVNGIAVAKNMLANIPYGIEARRYGYLFNQTLIQNLTASCWVNITCPTYTLFVHALDSNGLPLRNVNVSVHEWSTWNLMRSPQATNESGSTLFHVTFGKYKIKVYNYSAKLQQTVTLNETLIDLVEDPTFLLVQCKLFNLGLSVKVVDYFGRPIPNALVKVKRENVEMGDLITGSSGIALLDNVIGGRYQISVYIRGKLCGITSPRLDRSSEIVFKIDRYVVIAGYPMETSQLITLVSLSLLIGALGLALLYRKLPSMMKRKKTPSGKAS